MLRNKFHDKSNWFKILMLLLFTLLSTIVVSLLCVLWLGSMQNLWYLKIVQMLQTIGVFMIPCILMAYLCSEKGYEYLYLTTFPKWKSLLLVVVMMILVQPAINMLSWINEQLQLPTFLHGLEQWMQNQEQAAAALTERFIVADNILILLFNLLFMALLPAFCEELYFRAVLAKLISNKKHIAIWISAIIFAAIHFQFYGFVPRMLLGAVFGYLLYESGSLWLPVTAHFTNNALAVIIYNAFVNDKKTADLIDSFGRESTWWVGCISLFLACGLFAYILYALKRSSNKV